jgi:hypothetical protein
MKTANRLSSKAVIILSRLKAFNRDYRKIWNMPSRLIKVSGLKKRQYKAALDIGYLKKIINF